MTPVEFLTARYDEEADTAARDDDSAHRPGCARLDREFGWDCDCGLPAYVLADVAAKRAILALADQIDGAGEIAYADGGGEEVRNLGTAVIHALLKPFADHPDYDPKWAA